jgi:hypothetical protein
MSIVFTENFQILCQKKKLKKAGKALDAGARVRLV